MIYLDSSALLKMLVEETESAALEGWVSTRALPLVSSELARVEVVRACRRLDENVVPAARVLLATVDLIPLSGEVVEHAAEICPPRLRSLDALHLASALSIRAELSAFVAYDELLAGAASDAGLTTVAPGS